MGVSTDGQICFGIGGFEEENDSQFPWWTGDVDDNEIEDWWRDKCGWTEEWHKENVGYFDRQEAFDAANPLPIELVRHCSGEYMMYVIAMRGTVISCSRGEELELDPNSFLTTPENPQVLIDFCSANGLKLRDDQEPKWLLTSLWW